MWCDPSEMQPAQSNAPRFSLSGRIPELDGIRGAAISMVVVWHYFIGNMSAPRHSLEAYALAAGGLAWSGVDLFFVLSGFLIGGILIDARVSSNYFRVFYVRRFFRIVPLYYMFLFVCLIVPSLVQLLGWASRVAWLWQDALPWSSHLVFLQNFWIAYRNSWGMTPLSPMWSLAVEEQFYLTLPLAIRLLSRRHLVTFLIAGVLFAPLSRLLLHILWPDHPLAWHTLMPCRADALLLGVLGAVFMRQPTCRAWLLSRRNLMRSLLFVLASGIVVLTRYAFGFWNQTGTLVVTVGFTWLAAFYVCVLLYALLWGDSLLSRGFRWGWLRWLGSIAYGVYLTHQLVLNLAYGLIWSRRPMILSVANFGVSLSALALTLLLCQFSWEFFEKPLVKIGHWYGYRYERIPGSLGVAAAPAAES